MSKTKVLILKKNNLHIEYTTADEDKHICENLKFYHNNKVVGIMYGEEATAYWNCLFILKNAAYREEVIIDE